MFDVWIHEIRANLAKFGRRWSLLGGWKRDAPRALRRAGVEESLVHRYARLCEVGTPVWSAIVQANPTALEPHAGNVPANIVFGLGPYFDAKPHHLLRIAGQVSELKSTFPEDVTLAKVAAVVTDELNFVANWRLPYAMTDGHTVYLTSLVLHQPWLARGALSALLLPIVVAPETCAEAMCVPRECLPVAIRDDARPMTLAAERAGPIDVIAVSEVQRAKDERDAREHPHRALRADGLVAGASRAMISLTPACAIRMREMAQNARLGKRWHVVVGGDDNFRTLDLSRNAIPPECEVVESDGIRIAYPAKHRSRLRGCVIDIRQTSIGEGFVFIDP